MRRREAVGVVGGAVLTTLGGAPEGAPLRRRDNRLAGRLKQSVSYWPYGKIPLADFAAAAKKLGLVAIDLLQPEQWPVVKAAGLGASVWDDAERHGVFSYWSFTTAHFQQPLL